MKKTIQILFFSALSVAGFAQHKAAITQFEGPKALKKLTAEDPIKRAPQIQVTQNGNREIVFHETFESGFTGSTTFGAWTYSHNLTGVPSTQGSMWSIGDDTYVNVYGSGVAGSDALDSDSPGSYALFDGAQYAEDFPASLPATGFYSAFLNFPVLDFSELTTVMVDFQQVFRYCCFPGSPISLDVSVDGGTTWTVFNAIGTAVEGANVQSANPLNTTIDISCAAAGQSNVQLRFAYNSLEEAGYSHYFWAIDEVVIYTNDVENDLFIRELVNGNVLSDWEYRVTPQQQIIDSEDGGVVVGVNVGNKGAMEQSEVQVTFSFTLDGASTPEYEFTTESFHLYSALTDTVCPHLESAWFFWESDFEPAGLGLYTLSATINGVGVTDATPDDNTLSETIRFSEYEYAHDGDTGDDFQWQIGSGFVSGNSGPRQPSGFGSHFGFPNTGSSAHGITVRFGTNTVAGVEFKASLIANNASTEALDDSDEVASGNYETTESWLTNHGSEPLYFAFNSSFPVGGVYPAQPYPVQAISENNLNYVASIWRPTSGVGQLSVLAQDVNDSDLSSVAWQQGGDLDFHWFHFQEFNYAVRLILADSLIAVSTDEINAPSASFTVYPNPAVNETRVSFSLTESKFIAYEVRDLQGRLMDTDNIGRFGAGENSFALNVSEYAAGNYVVGLVIDGKQMLTQQFSVVK